MEKNSIFQTKKSAETAQPREAKLFVDWIKLHVWVWYKTYIKIKQKETVKLKNKQ